MPTGDDLVGLGVPPQLAEVLGNGPNALTTTGTSQATAATIKAHNTELTTAGSQTGAILPSAAKIGTLYYISNPTATSGVVYVPSGHYLNGSQNAGLTVAQNKGAILWQYKKTYWTSIINA